MKVCLFLLNTAALFFFFYYLWGIAVWKSHRLEYNKVRAMFDRQIMAAIRQHKRTRGIANTLEKMLRVTSLRPGGKPLLAWHFFCVTIACFLLGIVTATALLKNPIAGILLGCVGATVPYQLLQIDYKRNQKKLKRQTPQFLLAVGNMYGTYGDPVIALEQLGDRLKNPLKREVIWFVDSIKHGVAAQTCIETVKSRLPERILNDFFDDMFFYMKHGGDFHSAVSDLVKRTYDREMAEVERSAATFSAVIVFFVLVGVYFMTLFALSKAQPEIMRFLIDSAIGKMVVVAMVVIFIIAGYFTRAMVGFNDER
ncbi:type II secretion system F family protein [Desulfoscipio geothermicus]|uniref:Flp pilus assembly protein TadB n=1 Tax=Desulfoscipio geothermicus DSM 3669 TaxID=1121426 RepID=A0A1I6E1Z2_9FIRM|nr:hypothetical protein [Desulfoscipio geothermicus]SFR11760.1 Flp pilus assembly protein TadB [Desulfoscipio geothermicus DSM 3669]